MRSKTSGEAAITSFFIASLLTATFIGSKLTEIAGLTVSVGLFVFPFTFIACEIAAEVYGREFTQSLIRVGIVIQLYVLLLVALGGLLPVSNARDIGDAYEKMFSLAPRMILASILAYTVSQFLDLGIFLRIKEATQGKHLWLRANVASYASQAVDTAIFTGVFLGGVLPFRSLLAAGSVAYFVKILVGTIDTPIVYLGVKWLRRLESIPFSVHPVRSRIFHPREALVPYILESIPREKVKEKMVLAVTSKIVSLAENALVARTGDDEQKRKLIEDESEAFLGETLFGVALTIKHGLLIPSAGIDESNSENGDFILFPKDPYASAKELHEALRKAWGLRDLGIIITDSHTQPLRKGVTGIGLSHFGFKATRNLVGKADLFGREARMTHVNVLDALANAAVYQMGEISERCPLAIIYGSDAEFSESSSVKEIQIPADEDLYGHLLFPKK